MRRQPVGHPVPLYLTESDVAALLTPADAVEVIEGDLVAGGHTRAPERL